MYDIYLSAGCRSLPDLGDLLRRVPKLAEAALQEKLLARHPGFLELDVSEQDALALLERLRGSKARGQVVPAGYRTPSVSINDALPTAERFIAKLHETHFTSYTFEPVHFWREGPRWWIFLAGSEQLQREGVSPGAFFAYVDKLDGHVWQQPEIAHLLGE